MSLFFPFQIGLGSTLFYSLRKNAIPAMFYFLTKFTVYLQLNLHNVSYFPLANNNDYFATLCQVLFAYIITKSQIPPSS